MSRLPLAAALLATVLTGTPLPAAAQSGVGADDTRRLLERDIVVGVSAAGEGSGGRITAMLDIPVSRLAAFYGSKRQNGSGDRTARQPGY